MDLQKMGKFIADMRKKRGLTQSQLGEALGLSGKAISKWERGLNAPDISLLNDLAKVLDVNVSEILTGSLIEEEITTETVDEIAVSSVDTYNKFFKKKFTKTTIIFISIVLAILLIFSTIYLINNYNKCFVYKLSSDSKDFYLEGLIASNQKENSLIIAGMVYNDSYMGLEDELLTNGVEVLLLLNDKVIKREDLLYDKEDSLTNVVKGIKIVVNENPIMTKETINEKVLSEMKIILTFKYNELICKELTIPIKIEKKFSNNRLFY